MRPLGIPPPSAKSRLIEPVGIVSTLAAWASPKRIIEPLPNCFSICDNAKSKAWLFPLATGASLVFLSAMIPPIPFTSQKRVHPSAAGKIHAADAPQQIHLLLILYHGQTFKNC